MIVSLFSKGTLFAWIIDPNDIVNMKRAGLSGRNDDDADDVNRKNNWLYIHNEVEDSDDDAGDVNRKKAGLSVHNEGRPRLSSLFLGLTCFILTSRSTLGLYHLRDENSLISDLLHIDK